MADMKDEARPDIVIESKKIDTSENEPKKDEKEEPEQIEEK